MNPLIWLMRASRWARNPPSAKRVRLVLALLALIAVIVLLEWGGFWPDWAQMEPRRQRIPGF